MNLGKTKFFLSQLDIVKPSFSSFKTTSAHLKCIYINIDIYIAPLIVAPVLQQQQQSNRKLRTDYANYYKIMMVN